MRLIEKYVQVVRLAGLNTARPVNFSLSPRVDLPTATYVNGVIIGSGGGGGSAFTTDLTVTEASATALQIGLGLTNPALNVDTSTASSATGINIKSAAAGGNVVISAISSGANEKLVLQSKGTQNVQIQPGSDSTNIFSVANAANTVGYITVDSNTPKILLGSVSATQTTRVVSTGAAAFNVGPNTGGTILAFNVDTSTASSATGLNIKSAAAGAGVTLSVLSTGTNESLNVNAKGNGVVTINQGVAIAAGGSLQNGILFSSTANFGIIGGSGAPTVTAAAGAIYMRTDGSSTSTRAYVSAGGGTWIAITTAS